MLQTIVHRLAADQHHYRGFHIRIGYVSLCGGPQIYLAEGDGDDHNDGADADGSGQKLKVSCHESRADSRR
ncbi:hypothetical protein [Cupriavidus necator]|uniref:hypothetical protein n=1 Tax=Cupriavidus necator TaxID=106590 RepID=UPI0013E07D1F|nr:hypothetical protein [Cupriavidus necator]